MSIDTDANNDTTDGAITFSSTVDGGYALTLDADTGAVTLSGAVGGTTKLASLTVTKAGQVDLASVQTTGVIDIEGTNIDLNGLAYHSNDGDITFTGPVDLMANVSVNSDADNDGSDGAIRFTSTIDGAQTLTLDADGGAVALQGNVGGTTALTSFTVAQAGAVSLKSVKTTGAIAVTGTGITLGSAYESDDGNITFSGPVFLAGDVLVDSDADDDTTDGSITFTSTIDGGQTLTLDADGGAVALQGNVGGTTKLTSLTVDGGQIDLQGVQTTGAIDIEGTNIDLNGTVYETDGGNVTFTGPVDLTANVNVDSDADNDGSDGAIRFTSTIDGGQTLTLDADGGAVALQGNVGGTTKLTSLTVDGGQIDLQGVQTTGAIDIEGTNIDLNGTVYETDGGNVTFTGPVDLTANVNVDSDADNDGSDGAIRFTSTIDGGQTLTLDADGGAVALQGNVGGTTKLTSLTVDGGQIDLQGVQTTGAIDIEGTNIDLNGTVYETDGGNVTFTGPVDLTANVNVDSDADNDGSDGAIRFTSTIDGGQTLTLDADGGAVDLQGNVGGTTPLVNFTVAQGGAVSLESVTTKGIIAVTGTSIMLNGGYKSADGNVTFSGPVLLAGDVLVDSDADNDGSDGAIRFTSTIDGGQTLTLDADGGAVDLQGNVGGTTPLVNFTVAQGGAVSLESVTTKGIIAVTGTSIMLNGGYKSADGNVTFSGPVLLAGDVLVDSDADNDGSDGAIRFTSTIDGGSILTLNADTGNIDFDGDVGSTAKLGAITITKAHDVTVATSMSVVSFEQLAGTGTTDFGLNTIYADTFVNVTTMDIYGRIIAKTATLIASHFIGVTVEVDTLTIQAKNADMKGTVSGLGGGGAADSTIILNRGPGSYKLNGFTILGTGRGTRQYAELAALPLPNPTWRWGTPGDVVFLQFSPILRGSVVGAMGGSYPANIFEMPFTLLKPQAGMESLYDKLPGVIRDVWWRLGADANRNTNDDSHDEEPL